MPRLNHPVRLLRPALTLGARRTRRVRLGLIAAAAAGGLVAVAAQPAAAAPGAYVAPFNHVSRVASTVPANGDVNPYGVAVVPRSVGDLVAGDILVSNFNDKANLQGTGTTIVELSPSGHRRVFADLDSRRTNRHVGRVGLTTALAVLPNGWVVVGNLPTSNGTAATARAGNLIVLDAKGRVVRTISSRLIRGPWDLAALDRGNAADLFVTNVLNGTVAAKGSVVRRGTVVRIGLTAPRPGHGIPKVTGERVIGSGFAEQSSASALVLGPTGVGIGANGTLYVADTVANRIAAISHAVTRSTDAGSGATVSRNGALNGPLGLAVAPGGNLLIVNGGNGDLIDLTATGHQAALRTLDTSGSPAGSGALFGLAVAPHHRGVYFVDDATNALDLLGSGR